MSLVLFEEKNGLGIITLNSPKSLNSLSTEMVELITPKLKEWENNSSIKAVLQKSSSEKAFCAGGDVVALYNSFKDRTENAADFFTKEYELDLLIHQYKKPIICFGHGIVMGGGIGIMNGSSHRIVTEKTKLAMPELTIGFFPDVGASYFLNKVPGRTGLFMALTGCRLTTADCLYTKMADSYVPFEKLGALEAALAESKWAESDTENHKVVDTVIAGFTGNTSDLPESQLQVNHEAIEALCNHESIQNLAKTWNNYQAH